ncbi:MAG: hypothetical protein ABL959_17560, partial [Pyrinomonadaceae bacterium]
QWMITGIVGLAVFSAIGCSQSGNNSANSNSANINTAVNKSNSTTTDSNTVSPNSETSKIEQKANAIVGKWETTTALDDKITFDFSPSKKEGETYVGTYVFDVNGSKDPSAKYVVSADKMIKFFNEEGKEYPLIKVSISDDGKTLMYNDQKGGQSKLTKAGSQAGKTTDSADKEKGDCTVKADNAEFFIEATEKTVKLKKGTAIQYVQFGNQGIAIVKAQIDGKWVKGEIQHDDTTCN